MKNKKYLATILVLLVSFILISFIRGDSKKVEVLDREIKESLLEEFDNAYVKNIPKKTGEIKEFNITASVSYVEIMPGKKVEVWSYNGIVPGPKLEVNLGDKIKVNFKNELPQETTLHWHGVRVPNAMDGVPGVTQEPIKSGESFVYEFIPKDAGTFWFHPHVRTSEQLGRGLYGTLVVKDPNEYTYKQDELWVLDDWRLVEGGKIFDQFVTPMDLMHDGRWGNFIKVNDGLGSLEISKGEHVRLRLVNTSNARIYKPKFSADLSVKVIAIDGLLVKEPFNYSPLDISPGNRIDLDISLTNEAEVGKSYEVFDTFTRENNTLGNITVGLNSNEEDIRFKIPQNTKVPLWNDARALEVDKEFVLNARSGGMMNIEWTINGKTMEESDPVVLKKDNFYKMRFKNDSGRLHPMHIHGQFFKVISRDGIDVHEEYFRDTVLVYPNETVDIGLIALDEGSWVSHCHIVEHADSGMMFEFNVK